MSSGGVWRKLQAARPAWSLCVPTWEPGQALLTAAWGWEGGTETGGALRASSGDLGCQETGRRLGLGFGVRGTLPSPESCSAPRRYFFSSLVSASASLLCLITILLYVFIQYSVNPEVLRTHPLYEGTAGGEGGGGGSSLALLSLGSLVVVASPSSCLSGKALLLGDVSLARP